jgi:D-alanine transfer protein
VTAPHLLPAAAALLIIGAALGGVLLYARRVERRAVHAVATRPGPFVGRMRALQVESFRHPDLLPVYGTSEVVLKDRYHAAELFHDYPTGFRPVPVGHVGGAVLLHIQDLAGIGPALRGKKVVISCTPDAFWAETIRADHYAGNFSPLSANELAFSTDLSLAVKQAVARRMLLYPKTLEADPLLRFALEELADGGLAADALYEAALPLGKLQTLQLCLQDHWQTVRYIHEQRAGAEGRHPRRRSGLPWAGLVASAEGFCRHNTTSNHFGFNNRCWAERRRERYLSGKDKVSSDWLRGALRRSNEWGDLETLLRELQELGAEPLLVSAPMKGNFLAWTGIPAETRRGYYERFGATARAAGVPAVVFGAHDEDPFFLTDMTHLSSKGWVHYAYMLDGFYHGKRGEALVLNVPPGGASGSSAEEPAAVRTLPR